MGNKDHEYIEAALTEILSVVNEISDRVGVLEDGQTGLIAKQARFAESQAEGFREVNERLERIEQTINKTFA